MIVNGIWLLIMRKITHAVSKCPRTSASPDLFVILARLGENSHFFPPTGQRLQSIIKNQPPWVATDSFIELPPLVHRKNYAAIYGNWVQISIRTHPQVNYEEYQRWKTTSPSPNWSTGHEFRKPPQQRVCCVEPPDLAQKNNLTLPGFGVTSADLRWLSILNLFFSPLYKCLLVH